MAVDLNAVSMQENFAAADSEAINTAMRKLDARVPLGSTDMVGAMRAAEAGFDAASTNAKTVVYIGDGVSRGRLLGSPQLEQLTRDLVGKRISVSSYAVGPQVNVPLLAAIANQTGGLIVSDPENRASAQQIGSRLSASVRDGGLADRGRIAGGTPRTAPRESSATPERSRHGAHRTVG